MPVTQALPLHPIGGQREIRGERAIVGPTNPKSLPRVPLQGGTKLSTTLDAMDKPGALARYVSDGNPKTVASPP